MTIPRKQLIALVTMAKTGDTWTRGYAVETLRIRLAETADPKERQLIRLALSKVAA